MYTAQTREDILSALDDYTSGIRVLPREWQGDHKIDPPPKKTKKLGDELEEIDEDRRSGNFESYTQYNAGMCDSNPNYITG